MSSTVITANRGSASPSTSAPVLPAELMDMILDFITFCPMHPWSTRLNPCVGWHTPAEHRALLPLRLVSRSFAHRTTPILFHHLTCRGERHRHLMLREFSHKAHLIPFITVLRIEIAPRDLGARMRRVTQAINCPADAKLRHYFEVLRMVLPPVLRRFVAVRNFHITTTYAGLIEKRLPKLELLPECVETLCESVRKADLPEMEEITLGVPYEGGYTTFFEDLEDHKYKRMLKRAGRQIKSANVKLFDHQGNFTTMPFF